MACKYCIVFYLLLFWSALLSPLKAQTAPIAIDSVISLNEHLQIKKGDRQESEIIPFNDTGLDCEKTLLLNGLGLTCAFVKSSCPNAPDKIVKEITVMRNKDSNRNGLKNLWFS